MADNSSNSGFGRKKSGKKPKKTKKQKAHKLVRGKNRRGLFGGRDDAGGGTRFHRFGRRFWVWLISIGFTFCILGLGTLAYFARDLPDIGKLHNFERSPGIRIYAGSGQMIASYGQVVGEPLKYDEFPKELIAAVTATEDRRFFEHGGIDPLGLLRAMMRNVMAGGVVQGGSTITQQLAKNVFLTPERTLTRKLQEVLLAFWLENHFTKQQILELYLNRVYLGAGNYGVDAAAKHYFNKSARNLNLQESALIAGLLKAPSRYAPTRDPKIAEKRTKQVILNMQDAGVIKEEDATRAISHLPQALQFNNGGGGSARYFTDWVVDQLPEYIGRVDGDMEVLTTFDPKLQEKAQEILTRVMEKEGKEKKASQAALLAMEPDGTIRAMIGGVDYAKSQYNRAAQAKRQPGSAFKLLVYLAALEAGYTPDTMVSDRPITIGNWSPKNYTKDYRGEITLREAFYRSINTVAALITHQVGPQRVANIARKLGIHSKLLATPALSLGTNDVTLMEMTNAFAHMAAGGQVVIPHAVQEIRGGKGKLLYRYRPGSRPQAVDPWVVNSMNDLLSHVISSGTGRRAAIGRPAAGKTGTTQDYRDAWFLGFTPQLVTGVWMGNDDYSPMGKVTGGGLPAAVWAEFMKEALAGKPALGLDSVTASRPFAVSPQLTFTGSGELTAESAAPTPKKFPTIGQKTPPKGSPFDWFDRHQGNEQEQPVKDDTLLDKIYDKLEQGDVEYSYPGDRRRR